MFGLALRVRGWRVTFIGADTPIDTLAAASAQLEPQAVVLAAVVSQPLDAVADRLAALARDHSVFLAGDGADEHLADRIGARLLHAGPLEAVAEVGAEPSRA
jgi:methanogenic corrinoid protein MtbC1